MAYRALSDVYLGHAPTAHPGDILPDTFPDMEGNEVAVNSERLVELGAAEKISAAEAKKSEAKQSEQD